MEWADLIDYASTGGEIVEGPNSVVMTFLQGDWTFETDTGAADPLTLADGTVLSGFKLYSGASSYSDDPMVQTAANPSKAAFDTTLPVGGWAEYGIALKTSAAELDAGWLEVFSQFHSGNDNNTTLDGFHWNLSKGCDDDECGIDPGDRFVTMLGAELYGMYEDDPESLLPDESLVDADGNDPIGETDLDSTPVDGVTIVTDIAEFRLQSTGKTLVDTTATAAKAVAANLPRSRGAAIELAAAQQAGTETGSKSVSTTELGTLTSAWYETVIVASGDGSDRGTWNFDESVYNPDTGQYEEVVDGCLEETSDGTVYASCGWLESVWDDASGTYISDPGEFSWGFEPADPNDLGEYCDYSTGYWDDVTNEYVCGEPVAPYAPWNFEDLNGDGSIDYGSFQFTHYMQYEEVIEEVRVHRLTAKGVELPVTEVVLQ
ncbi:hypothetical protein [Thiohalomonas denitrificans]|nr:hypothetical protein [Thiohalomonas denitrificans]